MNKDCYLCGSFDLTKRNGKPRDNKSIDVLECKNCGLVFLSDFEHIDNKFYEESGMHKEDFQSKTIEDWLIETRVDDLRRKNQHKLRLFDKNILDFGCGNGGFLKETKQISKKVVGVELEKSVIDYWEGNIEINSSIEDILNKKEEFDVITLFHVLEHLKDPIKTLENISKCLKPNGQIIIEVPSSEDALLTLYDCEKFQNFSYWSQHLFLFNNKTIELLVKKSSLNISSIENYQRYSLSNHLYWLSRGLPNGHNIWHFLDSEELNKSYSNTLKQIKKTDTLIAYLSK